MKQNKICEVYQNVYNSIWEYIKEKEDKQEKREIFRKRERKYIDFLKHCKINNLSGNYRVMVDDRENSVKTIIYTDEGALIETRVPGDTYNCTYEGFVVRCDDDGNVFRNYVSASCECYMEESGEIIYYYETIERLRDGSFVQDYSVYQPAKKMKLNLPEEVDRRFLELSNKFMMTKSLSAPFIGE